MSYRVFQICCLPNVTEILIAFLAEAGFDSFEETDAGIAAYAPLGETQDWGSVVEALQSDYPFTYTSALLADKNWNEVWERQFEAIRIGHRLLIRASFHPPEPAMDREIVIDPKMAFGTGHHATTYMMCERTLAYFHRSPVQTVRVLDYGSGTGVLAILAKLLGAADVDAVDIEMAAYESTIDNAAGNGVGLNTVICGQLRDVPFGNPYDLIVANINRNVLLETGRALYDRLAVGGTALMSGILAQDEHLLIDHLRSVGFRHRATFTRGDWRAFDFARD